MKPWQAGSDVELIKIPASWYTDDAPPTMFVKAFPNSHGWITGRQLEEIWRDRSIGSAAITTTPFFRAPSTRTAPASRMC